jgi:hypothetical protein
MKPHASKVLIISIASFSLSAGMAGASRLQTFAACQIEYRIHNAIQDTFKCRLDTTLGFASILLFVLGGVTGLIALKRRLFRSSPK